MFDLDNMEELFNQAVGLTHKLDSEETDNPIEAALGAIARTGIHKAILPQPKPSAKATQQPKEEQPPKSEPAPLEDKVVEEKPMAKEEPVPAEPAAVAEPPPDAGGNVQPEPVEKIHKGRVISTESGEPVEGALVFWCAEKESVFTREAASVDSSGADGSFQIAFRDGYNTVRIVKENFFDRQYTLSPDPETVNEISIDDAPGSVPESRITGLLHHFHGYGYNFPVGKYPPGFDLSVLDQQDIAQSDEERYTNGNTFTEALLVRAWLEHNAGAGSFVWDIDKHNHWTLLEEYESAPVITRENRLDALQPAIDAGMADLVQKIPYEGQPIGENKLPEPWTLFQGFLYSTNAKGWIKGHNFIIVDYHKPSDRLLILESNGNRSPTQGPFPAPENGPRFTGFGHIEECFSDQAVNKPGPDWWKNDAVPTWQSIVEVYKYRVMVRLRVNSLELAQIEK